MKVKLGNDPKMGYGNTHLQALANARIVAFGKDDDEKFFAQEYCDQYFSVALTREQLLAIAAELVELANS